jgi:hypothetical protein
MPSDLDLLRLTPESADAQWCAARWRQLCYMLSIERYRRGNDLPIVDL